MAYFRPYRSLIKYFWLHSQRERNLTSSQQRLLPQSNTVDEVAFLKTDSNLKYVLKFRDDAIRHVLEDALNFFNNTYGLDFSASSPNETYQRSIEDAVMSPFIVLDHIEFVTMNNWIRTGNTCSICYRIQDGGIGVSCLPTGPSMAVMVELRESQFQ